jgi:hypothetical protein
VQRPEVDAGHEPRARFQRFVDQREGDAMCTHFGCTREHFGIDTHSARDCTSCA